MRKRPPVFRKWIEQRPRQAYEDFGLRAKTTFFFALLPMLIGVAVTLGARGLVTLLGVIAGLSWAVALCGRARGRAGDFIPLSCCLFAPLWLLERSVSTYWALSWYLTRGGYPFGDQVLSKGIGRAWSSGGRAAVRQIRQRPGP